ncbi:tetratricopeptide repeat protein [Candidatus Beckwithbacteria bacterium]|nr:tetratricopeptide repeat protein [Candidatus Beckwithbacteria bacterium]
MSKKHKNFQYKIQKKQIEKTFHLNELSPKIIYYLYLVLFFLTPFLVSITSSELFEFPKMLFVYLMTVLITGTYSLHMLFSGKIFYKKTWLHWPLLFFLFTQLLSSIFSMHPYTSWFGYYSRFHGGMFSSICYFLLVFVFLNYANKKWSKNVLLVSLAAASMISLFAIAEHLGIDADYWVQDVQNRVFSTLGQPNWLAAYLLILIPFALSYFLKPIKSIWPTMINLNLLNMLLSYLIISGLAQQKFPVNSLGVFGFAFILIIFDILAFWFMRDKFEIIAKHNRFNFLLIFTVLISALLFTKSRSAILALFASLLIFWLSYFFTKIKIDKSKLLNILIINSIFLILLFFLGKSWIIKIPQFKTTVSKTQTVQVKNPDTVSDSTDIRKIVWQGAVNIWQNHQFLGTGNETFAYSYYNYRPREHNDNSEWDFLYNKAHNEYLNYLANNGTIGTSAIFLLIIATLWFAIRKQNKKWLIFSAVSVVVSATIYLVFPDFAQKLINKILIYPPLLIPFGITFLMAILLFLVLQKLNKVENLTKNYYLNPALLASFISITITNFYGFSVVNVALFFFFIPAFTVLGSSLPILVEKQVISKVENSQDLKTIHYILATLIVVFSLILIIKINNLKVADDFYNQSRTYYRSGYIVKANDFIQKAIQLESNEANYYLQQALIDANAAYALATNDEASKSAQDIEQISKQTDLLAQIAIAKNPVHLNIYKSVIKVYLTLASFDKSYNEKAITTLEQAIKLSPTDPDLTLNLALIYEQLGENEKAEKYLRQTVELKPNYRKAWHNLGQFYQNQGRIEDAIQAFTFVLQNIDPTDGPSLKKIEILNTKK